MMVYVVVGIFMLLDILTGILKALYTGTMDSSVLHKGLFHKLAEIVAVVGSGLFEYGTSYVNLGVDLPVLEAVAGYICLMEFVSVTENLSEINPGLAKLFEPYLGKIKAKENDNGK